jgi:serine/threonine protein kinase
LIGPSGSGKEAAAHAVHDASKRKGAFIFVSCGELQTQNRHTPFGPAAVKAPERLLASKLELATNGTLFLDDVYELPQELQAELREWLSRTERPEARDEPAQPDVRVIASTTREPTGDSGSRAMFARLAGNTIKLPTLAERRADIPVLVDYFVRRHARQLGKNVEGVEAESMRRLEAYSWPGNIRELDAVISRAVLLSKGKAIRVDEELEEHRAVGSYHLVSPLGSGGMGEVWLAKHRLLARPAAVKLIRPEVTESADRDQFVRRFQREAQITAGLRSPHTVELYDFGVNDDGGFYYVMELLEGLDLHQIGTRFGPQPAERVIMLLRQACRSLAEAHALGLVHRDIKPANLFVARLGFEYDYLKVLDFGIVKDQPGSDTTLLSAQNLLPGTPAFMAPEVAFGEKVIDGRADLYSLACTAYWALTGQLLFRASTPAQMLLHHAQTAPVPPSQVSELPIPKELDAILMACLEKESAKRPASALELEERLSRVASDPWSSEQARRWWLLHAPEMVTQETLSPSTEESR